MNKGWLVVESGVQKLGDGSSLPRGRGALSVRVEEYYARKPTSQNLYEVEEVFYTNDAPDGREMDAVWDEMRTLRVKLNQIAGAGQGRQAFYNSQSQVPQHYGVPQVQPTYVQQTPVQQQAPSGGQDDATLNANVMRVMLNLLNSANSQAGGMDQLLTTRSKKETSSGQAGQGFQVTQ